MPADLFDKTVIRESQEAMDFMANVLEASTEYSIVGKDLDGRILLWNEGARRLYGYEPEEVVGKANSSMLHVPEDVRAGRHREIMDVARRDGKWEGTVERMRKNGQRFTARVVITPRRSAAGVVVGYLLISKNISDEIRLTEELKATQFYARSLIDASLDPLVTINPEGKITDVNEASVQATGVSREKLVGTDFSDYFTEPDKARAGYLQVFSQGFVRDYPLAIRHTTGRITDVLYNAALYKDDKGKVLGVFAAARDVTERKRADARQRSASAYARSLIEASLDPLVTISPEGKITDVNQGTELVTGIPRQRLIGTDFSDYFTEPDKARAGYQQVFSQGFVRDYPLAIRHTTGRITDVLYNASVYRDEKGNVLGVFAAARDITERKMAEELQRAASAYARSLIEASLDPLVTISSEGKITDVNEASAEVTGVPREQLIGTDFSDYFTEPDKARAGYQQVFSEGFVRDYPLAIRHTTGRITDVFYNASVYRDEKGKVLGVFAAARDVTERKRFELTLQEKNLELENANRAKDRFLASMSHELRTPLNAIIGFTGTLLMKLPGPLNADQEKQLRTIQTSGRHLLSLINDLLDLAKIESGKVELKFEPVPCQSILQEVAASLHSLAEDKGLTFEVKAPAADQVIQTDRRALTQVLLNLTTNAIKFTEKGRVCLELVQRQRDGKQETVVRVVDTGVGIRPEDQARLFQAFAQVGAGGRRHEGTGLGLHLSQKLAELLGSRIEFHSEFGTGSTFTLVLREE